MQERIAVLDVVQRLQDGFFADGVAVLEHPLDFADPYGDARKFGGVGVEFDTEDVGGRAFDGDLALQAECFGIEVGFVFEVLSRHFPMNSRGVISLTRSPDSSTPARHPPSRS